MAPQDINTGLTQARLKSLLNYEPATGVFTWLVWRPNGVKVGSEAGAIHQSGYRRIKLDGRAYAASRLAWLYMTGVWPEASVDHRDTNRLNDAWSNLRAATHAENMRNTSVQKGKAVPLKGVHLKRDAARVKPWGAVIRVGGVLKHLGYFRHAEEAHAAYAQAAHANFGQFARA